MAVPDDYTIICVTDIDWTSFSVQIPRNGVLGELRNKIKAAIGYLANIDAHKLILHHVNVPDDDRVEENVQKFLDPRKPPLPQGASPKLDNIFTSTQDNMIHLYVEIPSSTPQTLENRKRKAMEDVPPELFFKAAKQGEFSLYLNDIHPNQSPPDFVKKFGENLAQPRGVMDKEFTVKFSSSQQGDRAPILMPGAQSDSNQVATNLETVEVVHYLNMPNCFPSLEYPLLEAYRYGKERFFYACYLLPIEQYLWAHNLKQDSKPITFEPNRSWGFTFIARVDGNDLFSYSPQSDWQLKMEGIPCLHIEVCSDPGNETDKDRMLIQAACLVRTINALRVATTTANDWNFVDVCIYIDTVLIASWYTVYQPNAGDHKIEYLMLKFDLKKPDERLRFLVQLYNFPSAAQRWDFQSIKASWVRNFDKVKSFGFPGFTQTTKRPKTETAKSRTSGNTAGGAGGSYTTRHYDDPSVEELLSQHGYRLVKHVDLPGWKLLNPLKSTLCRAERSDGERVVLKLVERNSEELIIHKMLHAIKSPFNHTIPFLQEFLFEFGTIIVVPSALTLSLVPKLTLNTFCDNLARQFLEGVGFMHQHLIAHLDLKPDNLVVTEMQSCPRILIIDFGTSVQVESRDDLITGYRGTAGWVAPEVGSHETPDQSFSPINADLWACGKMVQWFISHSQDLYSSEGNNLTRLATELMDREPQRRPMLTLPLRLQGVKRKRGIGALDVNGEGQHLRASLHGQSVI